MVKIHRAAIAVFENSTEARRAIQDLVEAGFGDEQIGMVTRADDHGNEITVIDKDQKVPQAATVGAVAGAGLGTLWAVGIATFGLPAVGPVIAGGILASILASAAGGAAVGGLVGALIGMGVPEQEARYYQTEFEAGRTIVTVHAGDRYDQAVEILHRHKGYDMQSAATLSRTSLP